MIEVSFEPVYRVRIHLKSDVPGRVQVCELAGKFQEWCLNEDVYTIRGTMAAGPHMFVGDFPMEHADKIERWFMENGWE